METRTTPDYISSEEIRRYAWELEQKKRSHCSKQLNLHKRNNINWELHDGTHRMMPEWEVPLPDGCRVVIRKIPPNHNMFPCNPRMVFSDDLISEILVFGSWGTAEEPLVDPDQKWCVGDADPTPWPIGEHYENAIDRWFPNTISDIPDEDCITWYFESNKIVQVPVQAVLSMHGIDPCIKLNVAHSGRILGTHLKRIGWAFASFDIVKNLNSPAVSEQEEFPFKDIYPELRDLSHKELVYSAINEIVAEIMQYSMWLEKRAYYMQLQNSRGLKCGEEGPFIGEAEWPHYIDGLARKLTTYKKQKIII